MRDINDISVPMTADSAELRDFVQSVYESCGENYTEAGRLIGVNADTVRKLILGFQKDSQIIRDRLDIKRTKVRPRVWMPTNNCGAAIDKLLVHYGITEVIENLMVASKQIDTVIWYGSGEEGKFEGIRERVENLQ